MSGGGQGATAIDAIGLLLECEKEQERLHVQLRKFELESTPVQVYQLGVSTVAPSPAIAKAMQLAAASAIALDGVASEAAAITDSLSTLSQQAEFAVRRVRELDTLRSRIQSALDRVEDIIDLRQCLSGVSAAMQRDDMQEAALNVKRFRAIERMLPVPEADIAVMRDAEAKLLTVVTRDLDAAILTASTTSASSSSGSSSSSSGNPAELSATITKCCQLMNVLGHADMGLTRFTSYLKQKFQAECLGELRTLAQVPGHVDAKVAAVNGLSSILARAAVALDSAGSLAAGLFAAEDGPVTVLIAVHAVADKFAARVTASFARSGRLQALTAARAALLQRAQAGHEEGATSSSSAFAAAAAGASTPVPGSSAALTTDRRDLAALLREAEDDSNDAPFAAPAGSVISPLYASVDYSDAPQYDAMLDEIAIFLQRCASYARLLGARAAEIDRLQRLQPLSVGGHVTGRSSSAGFAVVGGSAPSSASAHSTAGDAASPVPARLSAEAAVASSGFKLREASGELGALYSLLESATIEAGLSKAISIDAVSEDGAQGASIDIMSIGTVFASQERQALPLPTSSSSSSLLQPPLLLPTSTAAADVYTTDGTVADDAGAGASISTLIEDAFYVCQKALRRAFATGNADCAASLVNHASQALTDVLVAELEARLRFAFDESGASGAAGAGGSSSSGGGTGGHFEASQSSRLSLLRAALMASGPVRSAAARLSEYQAISSPARQGGPMGSNSPMAPGAGAGGAGSGGPSAAGAGGAGSPMVPGRGGASGAGGGGDHAPSSSSGPGGATQPTAKLTEEVAAAALALNDLQLAAACCVQLQQLLLEEAGGTFSDERELAKVRSCVGNLADVGAAFRKTQDGGISTLCARLTPRLRSAINVFEGQSSLIQYDISEEAFAAASEGLNAFVTEFLPVLASILAPLQYALTPALSCAVVTKVATYVSKQLEPRIRRKRFNQLGGIQFDADMRTLVSFFVARSSRRVREKFTRLLQIAQLLNLESPAEVLEYWGSGGRGEAAAGVGGPAAASAPALQWELSAEEVRAVLGLRTDFSGAAIAALRL